MGIKKFLLRVAKNFKFLPKKTFLKIRYQYYTGKKLNLENPIEFNEKIQWLKLYYHIPLLTQLADKYKVREYVSKKIGEQYLNELYGVYDCVDKIDFSLFPSKFVLKGVHASSTNLVVTDKKKLDINKTKRLLKKWLKHDQYKKVGYEWAYKNIKPLIICEAYLEDSNENLIDCKFYCFNGTPKFVFFSLINNTNTQRFVNYYDLKWNEFPVSKNIKNASNYHFKKPDNFDKMIDLATKLADNLPFVRVDFYNINEKIIFGEMTFYPSDGKRDYYPDKYNKIIGDYITLPKIPENEKIITVY
jgi:hypothetical protein